MPETLVTLVSQYGYAVIAVSVLLMSAGVPVPGHTAYLVAAIVAGRGALMLPVLMIIALCATLVGSFAGFALGQRGGRRVVLVYGPRVGLSDERLKLMERFFEKYGAWAVFLTRFVVVIRTFGALFAGVSRVPLRTFSIVNVASALVWAGGYGAAGYFFGDRWNVIEDWFGKIGLIVLALLAAAGVAHALWRWWKRRRGS